MGPRIFTAGQALVCTGGHGHEGTDTVECDGADGFRRGARAQIREGADLIKVMISGGIAGEHEAIDTPQLTEDEIAAVLETAHAWGRKVTAHAGPAPDHRDGGAAGARLRRARLPADARGERADGPARHRARAHAHRHPVR